MSAYVENTPFKGIQMYFSTLADIPLQPLPERQATEGRRATQQQQHSATLLDPSNSILDNSEYSFFFKVSNSPDNPYKGKFME